MVAETPPQVTSKALFVTDWDNIERFVQDVSRTNKISNATREHLESRLASSEDHIVLITLSVLDSFVVNCSRDVRDQLASPVWMKILLNCFVGNLSKKHIRDCIQQLFSNWRQLLRGESLGQQAVSVCKHMQVKNYVVPPPSEYAPEVVTAVRNNHPPTQFVRGYDFYTRVYGTVVEESSDTSRAMRSSDSTTSSVALQSNRSSGQAESAKDAASESAADKLERMQSDGAAMDAATAACLAAGTRLQSEKGQRRGGVFLDANDVTALKEALARGEECSIRCQSWSDAVQRMIEDGMNEQEMMRALELNEQLCSIRERWVSVAAHQTQVLKAAQQTEAAVSTLAAAAAAAGAGSPRHGAGPSSIRSSPFADWQTKDADSNSSAGRPSSLGKPNVPVPSSSTHGGQHRRIPSNVSSNSTAQSQEQLIGHTKQRTSIGSAGAASTSGPDLITAVPAGGSFRRTSSQVSPAPSFNQNIPLTSPSWQEHRPETNGGGNTFASRRHVADDLFSTADSTSLRSVDGNAPKDAGQKRKSNNPFGSDSDISALGTPVVDADNTAACSAEDMSLIKHQVAALESALSSERRGRELTEQQMQRLVEQVQHLTAAADELRSQLSNTRGELAEARQHVAVLEKRLEEPIPQQVTSSASRESAAKQVAATRAQSAVEWNMLASADMRPSVKESGASFNVRSISMQLGSDKGPVKAPSKRLLARMDSFSAAQAATAAPVNSGGDASQGGDSTAAMLAAYRRMPALRVRFTPQHFANLVTTVSEEWNGQPQLQEAA